MRIFYRYQDNSKSLRYILELFSFQRNESTFEIFEGHLSVHTKTKLIRTFKSCFHIKLNAVWIALSALNKNRYPQQLLAFQQKKKSFKLVIQYKKKHRSYFSFSFYFTFFTAVCFIFILWFYLIVFFYLFFLFHFKLFFIYFF